jgi:hypothetical protein
MVDWLGPSPLSADQLLAGTDHGAQGPRDRAATFLQQLLADGPRTSGDVWRAAQKAGHAPRTVQRAKRELDVHSQRVFADGRLVSYWSLPPPQRPAGTSASAELERWFAQLQEQFPRPVPLDAGGLDRE